MMLRYLHIPFLLLFGACMFMGCGDNNKKTQASILGRWELSKGFRNKIETGTLAGVFFQFGEDGKMMTNLPLGADVPTDYELKKNEIHQKSPQEVVYNIMSVTDSMLVLTMEMRGVEFELHLQRAPEPAEELLETEGDSIQTSDSLSQ